MIEKCSPLVAPDYPPLVSEYLDNRDVYSYSVDNTVVFNRFCQDYDGMTDIAPKKRKQNIYIGYPWCHTICPFCVYTSGRTDRPESIEDYTDLITIEAGLLGLSSRETTSLYWGGGTPTMLDIPSLDYFLRKTSDLLSFSKNTVLTIESDIRNLTLDKLDIMRQYANRLSLGVQRFSSSDRLRLGRKTEQNKVLDALKTATRFFDNINVDLIYGIMDDSQESIVAELSFLLDIGVKSVTLYKQEYFINKSRRYLYKAGMPNTVECAKIFDAAHVFLSENGYGQQPVGWFSQDGAHSTNWKSRLDGWRDYPDYFGLGPHAYSQLEDMYLRNTDIYHDYQHELMNNRLPVKSYRIKSPIEKELQVIIRKFRLSQRIAQDDLIVCLGIFPDFLKELLELFHSPLYLLFFQDEDNVFILRKQYYSVIHWIINDICEIACNSIATGDENHDSL